MSLVGIVGALDRARRALLSDRPSQLVPTLRIVLCTWLACIRLPDEARAFTSAARLPVELLHAPATEAFLAAIGLPWPLPPLVVNALPAALVVLAILGAVGLCTRPALAALFACWLVAGGAASGRGFFNHAPALPAQLVLLLAIVPGTTAWSLDRFLLARIRGSQLTPPVAPWFGEVCVLLNVGVVYAASGLAKLRWGGASWLDGSTLATYLRGQPANLWFGPVAVDPALAWRDGFGVAGYAYLSGAWGAVLTKVPGVPALLAIGSLAIELSAPLLLLAGPRARGAFCVAATIFHLVVIITIGPSFLAWVVVLVAIFPWPETRAWWRARRGRATSPRVPPTLAAPAP